MSKKRQKIPPISPTKGFLLLEPIDQEQGKVVIAGVEETPQRAKVLKVGPDTWHEGLHEKFEAPAKKGDIVIHSSHGYEDIRWEGARYRLCPFSRILAVVSK